MVKRALSLALLVLLAGDAAARPAVCRQFGPRGIERPAPPFCVDSLLGPGAAYMREGCRYEIEAHRALLQQYLDCLNAEARETADEFSALVRRFNAGQ